MPLPLAPLVPLALRIGAIAAAGWAVKRAIDRNVHPGRTDQRAEDALDAMDEGLAVHSPADRATPTQRQANTAGRIVRTISLGGHRLELDAAFLARLRIRKT